MMMVSWGASAASRLSLVESRLSLPFSSLIMLEEEMREPSNEVLLACVAMRQSEAIQPLPLNPLPCVVFRT
jgi:hypothetical protein